MPAERIAARTVVFIVVVFLALVVVHLRWGTDVEEDEAAGEAGPSVARIQIADDGQLVDVTSGPMLAEEGPEPVIRAALEELASESAERRRAVAIQLSFLTDDPAAHERLLALPAELSAMVRGALLDGLRDPDPTVAANCAEALIGWWRISPSGTATRHFQRGLAQFETGRLEAALETFRSVEALGGAVPPDLYRMKAEVHLAQTDAQKALNECRRALRAEPMEFPALYAQARAQARLGQTAEAVQSLDEALAIYGSFEAARRLREQLTAGAETPPAQPAP